jgi:hypothetical protein
MPPERSHVSFHQQRTNRWLCSGLLCAQKDIVGLLNYLVGLLQKRFGDRETEHVGDLEVDDKLEPGR